MWPRLFLACGIVLIILGVECIVVGRFTISQEARLPTFVEKMFNGGYDEGRFVGSAEGNQGLAIAQAQSAQGYGGLPNQVSRFGPSRFGGSAYGNDQFFGGSSTNTQLPTGGLANPQFDLAGYGTATGSPGWSSKLGMKRIVQTRDWMPWSLIAAGSIIVLYTNSLGRHEHGNGG